MSFIEDNLNTYKIGTSGEELVRKWFIQKNIPFMQVDIMFKHNGVWCLGEVKTQEKFNSPPFDGHGLPHWQIDRRLEFQRDTGIKAYLIIYDLNDKCLYIGSFDKLLEGRYFQTKGKNPRIVFDIESFKKIEL
jgi:hypothetical protein